MIKKILFLFLLFSNLSFADKVIILENKSLINLQKEINDFIQDKKVKNISIGVAEKEISEKLIEFVKTFKVKNNYIACIVYEEVEDEK